jgi:hypothetical protein
VGYFPFVTASSSSSGYPAEPVVSGTPTAGQVLTAETATTATWENSASGFANPMTTAGDLIDGGTAGAAQRLGIGSTGQGLLVVGGAPAWANTVNSVTAGDASINIGGTALAPTIETDTLNTIAANHTTDGNVGMNGFKLTGLASGSASTDSAAFGQTLAGGDLAPLTTAGDLLIANATPAPARLAIGTAAGSTGDFLGITSGLPAWQQVSGQYLCAPTQYAPGTAGTFTTSSSTMAAVSSGNINTGSFTAPPSGSVIVTAAFMANCATLGDVASFGLCAHGTVTPMIGYVTQARAAASSFSPMAIQFLVTGLVAGNSYNFDLMFASPSSVVVTVFAYGVTSTTPGTSSGCPVVMTVQAV